MWKDSRESVHREVYNLYPTRNIQAIIFIYFLYLFIFYIIARSCVKRYLTYLKLTVP